MAATQLFTGCATYEEFDGQKYGAAENASIRNRGDAYAGRTGIAPF